MKILVLKDILKILAPKEIDPYPFGCQLDNQMINLRPCIPY